MFNPDIRRRRSIRLKEYDYSQPGAYFVTICTHRRQCLFGDVINGEMRLNEYGKIVKNEWLKTVELRANVLLNQYIIMPNHLHGIVIINDNGRGVLQCAPTQSFRSPTQTIGAIVRGFKSSTTKYINQIRNTLGTSIWQRNYYEHVIRNEKELNRIKKIHHRKSYEMGYGP